MVKSINDLSSSNDLMQQIDQQPPPAPAPQPAQPEMQQHQVEQPQDNVKDFAKKKGHIDKETWIAQGRNPDLYVDEETWVKNYTWLNQINDLKKETREQKEALEYLVKLNEQSKALGEKIGREKQIEEYKKQQIEAIASGDPEKITAITEKLIIEQNKDKGLDIPQVSPGTDPSVVDFLERNKSWFNDKTPLNSSAKIYAAKREEELANSQPELSLKERLKTVENEVKTRFFANPSTTQASPVSPATNAPVKKDEVDISSLPEFHQKMIQRLQKSTRNFNMQRYMQLVSEVEMNNYKDNALR